MSYIYGFNLFTFLITNYKYTPTDQALPYPSQPPGIFQNEIVLRIFQFQVCYGFHIDCGPRSKPAPVNYFEVDLRLLF